MLMLKLINQWFHPSYAIISWNIKLLILDFFIDAQLGWDKLSIKLIKHLL